MANNVKRLKKDVDQVIDEVVMDCLVYMDFNPGKNEEAIFDIIEKACDLRDDMINKINHVQDNPVKPYFRKIKDDFISGADGLFLKISELSK